jgi:sporulation protein YlmC with PRC-barrel domain
MNHVQRVFALMTCAVVAAGTALAADDAARANVPAGVFRASALESIPFRNAKGEHLGKLEDLVVNKDGKIVYGVLSYGGVAGVGDKLFAVPPSQLALGDMPGNTSKKQFTVNVDKSQLETTPGFNEKDLPTAASPVFMAHDSTRDAGAGKADTDLWRVRKITGMTVKNTAGEDLGKVNDVMVSLKDAKVVYVALAYGSTLTGNAKYFAVPWNALELKTLTGKPSDVTFVLDVAKSALDTAAGFDKNNWPTEPDTRMFRRK